MPTSDAMNCMLNISRLLDEVSGQVKAAQRLMGNERHIVVRLGEIGKAADNADYKNESLMNQMKLQY